MKGKRWRLLTDLDSSSLDDDPPVPTVLTEVPTDTDWKYHWYQEDCFLVKKRVPISYSLRVKMRYIV